MDLEVAFSASVFRCGEVAENLLSFGVLEQAEVSGRGRWRLGFWRKERARCEDAVHATAAWDTEGTRPVDGVLPITPGRTFLGPDRELPRIHPADGLHARLFDLLAPAERHT
ncbi:hypothetical protein ACFC08_36650 [Streptomyces sp. NPDC056112]|uniref:hypothetical protein n=1 Tax=Streptomyces sp. NPDC056112 TaxID=3345715 RepID=UPI0035D8228E